MDDGYCDTQIKPNMGIYTAIWHGKINGALEERHLIHDAVNGDRYYKNGILATTPTLPDPTQTLKLGATAPIGETDTVDTHEQNWEFWLTVQEPDFTVTVDGEALTHDGEIVTFTN